MSSQQTLIEKIIIHPDRTNPCIHIEVKENTDGDTILKAYELLSFYTERGLAPRAMIYYKGKIFRIGFPSKSSLQSQSWSLPS